MAVFFRGDGGHAAIAVVDREPDAEFQPSDASWYSKPLFAPNGTHLVAFGSTGNKGLAGVGVWELKSQKLAKFNIELDGYVADAVFTRDGQELLASGSDGTIRVYSWPTLEPKRAFHQEGFNKLPCRLATLDGKKLLTATNTIGDLRIWDLDTGKSAPVAAPDEIVGSFDVSMNGQRVAVQYVGQVTVILDAQRIKAVGHLQINDNVFLSVAFSPDGKWIATSVTDGSIVLWSNVSFKKERVFIGASNNAKAIVFSRDSELLICCTESESCTDGTVVLSNVYIWNVESGKLVYAFRPQKTATSGIKLALSPDGRWLLTNFRLWDLDKIRREFVQ